MDDSVAVQPKRQAGAAGRRTRSRGPAGASRSEILRIATRKFMEQGYTAVSVRDIAAEVGVDHAMIYRHYSSKLGLFRAVVANTGPMTWLEEDQAWVDQLVQAAIGAESNVASDQADLLLGSLDDMGALRLASSAFLATVDGLSVRLRATSDANTNTALAAAMILGLHALCCLDGAAGEESARRAMSQRLRRFLNSLLELH